MPSMFMIKAAVFAIVLVCGLSTQLVTRGQSEIPARPRLINGSSNEDAKLGLGSIATAAGERKLIIMISRLGDTESVRGLGRNRLRIARDYLKYTHGITDQRVVPAQGDPVKGKGRIDVYIDGALNSTFVFERNKNFAPEP